MMKAEVQMDLAETRSKQNTLTVTDVESRKDTATSNTLSPTSFDIETPRNLTNFGSTNREPKRYQHNEIAIEGKNEICITADYFSTDEDDDELYSGNDITTPNGMTDDGYGDV